ncbi:uncharacterized protein LOC115543599 [Gadus morhua]|uniref:uncharacterized protein LOC115543599 n=1 Tax=Gadus morhua TaxID=8049 RepID=UPI0011B5D3A6|nr:uncharacterized protein LOC115543599 [Gadus morhua]XP_030211872.1 uncharacterized protein LOC115543599 [Gadus morhua]
MEDSDLKQDPKGPSPQRGLPRLTPGVTVHPNPLLCQPRHTGQNHHHVRPCPQQELGCPSADLPFQRFQPLHGAPSRDRDGRTSQSRMDCGPPAASHSRWFGASDGFRCWDRQRDATVRASVDTRSRESDYVDRCQDDEEQLERPLSLRSDIDGQEYRPTAPCYTHLPLQNHSADWPLYNAQHGPFRELHYAVKPYGNAPHPHSVSCQDARPWMQYPQNCLRSGAESANHCNAQGGISVNVPQFALPPAERLAQVSVMNLEHLGLDGVPPGEGAYSDPNERRKTISPPDECRNIFITFSVDSATQMVPFAEFLTNQGFRPAIDIFDNPIRRMDINKWMDSYLKDPSVLIIIAISSGYKAAIERTGMDRHSLHTKYIYSMMQNEFIQQGSLNYRFVPVLLPLATQSHVPGWLQNTHVYRWPQDKENLLLRLLREERYVVPPVPKELTLIIKPVTLSSLATF